MRAYHDDRRTVAWANPKSIIQTPKSTPVWLTLFLLPAIAAHADVTLRLDARETYVDESVVARVVVSDYDTVTPPVAPATPDFLIESQGGMQSSQTSIVNGRMRTSRSYVFTFQITPRRAGQLEIPPFEVTVDGKTQFTEPTLIQVKPSDAGEFLFAEITCNAPRLFAGQQATFTLHIGLKPVRAYDRLLTEAEMFDFVRTGSGEYGEFAGSGQRPDVGFRNRTGADGKPARFYVYSLKCRRIVDRPGENPFADIVVGVNYPVKFQRDVFMNLGVTESRRMRVRPALLIPTIEPLPSEGRPANFTGAVGRFRFDARAKPTDARVGDPIELTIVASGDGPLDTIPPPNLADHVALTDAFRVSNEPVASKMEPGRRVFTQFIRPRRADVTEVPPVEYAFFDPVAANYETARTAAIPLKITAAAQLAAADLTDISAPRTQPAAEIAPVDALRGIEVREERLLARSPETTAAHVALATFAPPALALCVWGWSLIAGARAAPTASRRRAEALAAARRRIADAATMPAPQAAHEISVALASYLAARLNVPSASVAGRAGVDALRARGVAAEAVQRTASLADRCAQVLYGATDSVDVSLADEARECLAALENLRW